MELIQFLQQFDFPPILFLMKGVTLLGNFYTYPIYLIISYFILNRKDWLSFLGIILGSWAVNEALKHGFHSRVHRKNFILFLSPVPDFQADMPRWLWWCGVGSASITIELCQPQLWFLWLDFRECIWGSTFRIKSWADGPLVLWF